MRKEFSLPEAIEILERTPRVIEALLSGVSDGWTASGGDAGEWRAFDVVGHLIHGEETDWIPRARIILDQGENRTFEPFDRFAQFERSKGKSLEELLGEFGEVRAESLATLQSWELTDDQLELEGMHPELGLVTMGQLLATWVVHDLNHIRQIVTSMARRYGDDVGVWKEYLSVLK
jgi:hypothetical protein